MKKLPALLLAAGFLLAAVSLPAQITGAWSFGDTTTNDSGVLVFFSNGYYFHIEDALSGTDSFERGTYSWNGTNGSSFTVNPIVNLNGSVGLSSLHSGATLSITGNNFQFGNPEGMGGFGDTLSRVTGGSAIVGAWYDGDVTATTSSNVLVFLANNTYFLATDASGNQGIERGTYSWNSGDNAFTATPAIDTNGTFGLSHAPFITSASISGNILTLTDSGGPSNLSNVSAIPEPSTYAGLAGLGALGLVFWRRRRQLTA